MRIPIIPQQYAVQSYQMRASHIENVLKPHNLIEKAEWCAEQVRRIKPNTLVCRGSSGLIVTSVVATITRLPIGYVRKPEESLHTSLDFEGPYQLGSYVVIDDLVSSGETMKSIAAAVKAHDAAAKLAGICLYYSEIFCYPYSSIAYNAGF